MAHYDITQLLTPHSDRAFYDTPDQVQGFYGLEVKRGNIRASFPSALSTKREEFPDLHHHLHDAPMAIGRVVRYYGDPLYQATVDTVVTFPSGFPRPGQAREMASQFDGGVAIPVQRAQGSSARAPALPGDHTPWHSTAEAGPQDGGLVCLGQLSAFYMDGSAF